MSFVEAVTLWRASVLYQSSVSVNEATINAAKSYRVTQKPTKACLNWTSLWELKWADPFVQREGELIKHLAGLIARLVFSKSWGRQGARWTKQDSEWEKRGRWMRGDLSSGVRSLFWQVSLMNSCVPESSSLSINLQIIPADEGWKKWTVGGHSQGTVCRSWRSQTCHETAIKNLHTLLETQWRNESKKAPFPLNVIPNIPTHFMTF